MRKRSEVGSAATTADPRQITVPATEPVTHPERAVHTVVNSELPLPTGCEVTDNVFFIKCAECGMNQGSLMAKKGENDRLQCFRCNAPFDPSLTPTFIENARAKWRADQKKKPPVVTPPPSQQAAPADAPPPKPQCETCKAFLTITSLGKFYPCGHDPRKQNPPPESRPIIGDEMRAKQVSGNARGDQTLKAPQSEKEAVRGDLLCMGASVTATYGKETFTPRAFNTFEVGPFTATVNVLDDESLTSAMESANQELREFAAIEFKRKAEDFLKRLGVLTKMLADAP